MNELIASGAAAGLFALTFLFGGRIHPLSFLFRDRRNMISFGAGMSAAYVFVHLMPELHGARQSFAESVSIELRYEGMAIYLVALIGFLVFYGLDEMRGRLKQSAGTGETGPDFKLHLSGLAAYVWLMAYLLVHSLEETPASMLLYATAIACHFLSMDHSLREEHGAPYERIGRPLLAGMCVLGWGVGQVVALPPSAVALLVAFISGAIIMNNTIMELPTEKDGRFVPFMIGGLLYGLLLVPLG